ncbi:hypothetical protein SAMN04489716_1618 [Actinoplanes derwentensis]|uniref:Uncharacterized protein n=1 Tax=Actinoplanes derwentensis TaxID=113562 RepID=A0A1H1V2K4_9ACTN|nr:hypothetical protein Ade03nite_87570 [Actinoplanes derwentensis]SDS78840.1 hypothetical protein SAMN04489716_1618 [Actinoplanes derwentensis]
MTERKKTEPKTDDIKSQGDSQPGDDKAETFRLMKEAVEKSGVNPTPCSVCGSVVEPHQHAEADE